MKGFIGFMLLLIPVLGYFILRSDPIIYSNNVEKNDTTVKQVQAFAAFIEKQPELAVRAPVAVKPEIPASTPARQLSDEQIKQKEQAKEMVGELTDIWREHPPAYDQQWRNQVEKLFDLAEQSQSEEALDLIQTQILAGRVHSDDLNREQADKWLTHYMKLEKRESKVREMSDYFKEKVLDRIDQDERKMRENP
jgi:hypothetical protein